MIKKCTMLLYYKVLFGVFLIFASTTPDACAARRLEELSTVNQRFTRGYDFRTYSRKTHDRSTYELLVPEETKKKDLENAIQDKERNLDLWRYSRSLVYSATYDSNISNRRTVPEDDTLHNYSGTFAMTRQGRYNFVELFYDLAYGHQ